MSNPMLRWIRTNPTVAALVGLAVVLSLASGQNPTGSWLGNALWTGGFASLVVLAGARASSRSRLISSLLALFFTGMQIPAVILGLVGAGLAFWLASRPPTVEPYRKELGALVGLVVTQTVLRLPDIEFVTTASAFGAISVAPMLVSAWRSLSVGRRRYWLRAGGLVPAFCLMGAFGVGLAGLAARADVETAIDQVNRGVDALEAVEQETARASLEAAEAGFGSAADRLGGPLTWPGRLVPVVGQHIVAIDTAAEQGAVLAATAARTVNAADIDQITGSGGAIDLAVVRDVNVELATATTAMLAASNELESVGSPWLVPMLADRLDEVGADLATMNEDIDLAYRATSIIPGFLGGEGARTYLVLFSQPAEARELGGLASGYGLLRAENGRLVMLESGSTDEGGLGAGAATLSDPSAFPEWYVLMSPHRYPQNLTALADLATVSRAAADLLPQWRQDPATTIDGVILMDPYALAALLELTGPIELPGRGTEIGADNVVDFLLRDQYLAFDSDGRAARQDALHALAGVTFDRLLGIDLPSPDRLAELFGPLGRAERLSIYSFDPDENAFFTQVGLDANMPVVGEAVEMLGVYTQTVVPAKLDGYSRRDLHYVVEVDPATGVTKGRLEIDLVNGAHPELPAYVLGLDLSVGLEGRELNLGDHQVSLAIYSRAEVGPPASEATMQVLPSYPLLSYERYHTLVEVPLGESRQVVYEIEGKVEPGRYDLLIMAQPVAQVGNLYVEVRPAPGWRVVGAEPGSWHHQVQLDQHQAITLDFEPLP